MNPNVMTAPEFNATQIDQQFAAMVAMEGLMASVMAMQQMPTAAEALETPGVAVQAVAEANLATASHSVEANLDAALWQVHAAQTAEFEAQVRRSLDKLFADDDEDSEDLVGARR